MTETNVLYKNSRDHDFHSQVPWTNTLFMFFFPLYKRVEMVPSPSPLVQNQT